MSKNDDDKLKPKVVRINGEPHIGDDGKPVTEVIDLLEEMLEAARSGELCGVHMGLVWKDEATGRSSAGFSSLALIGQLELIKLDQLLTRKEQDG